jgi:hypothetical protein
MSSETSSEDGMDQITKVVRAARARHVRFDPRSNDEMLRLLKAARSRGSRIAHAHTRGTDDMQQVSRAITAWEQSRTRARDTRKGRK